MNILSAVVFAFITFVVASAGATERRVLTIPVFPFEQTHSGEMRQQLKTLEAERALLELSSWTAVPELPAWAFVEGKREIAYVFSRPLMSDGYRYAVIMGERKQLIVVRAGGIGGTYEVFSRPRESCPAEKGSSSVGT
jgi:hypothetical protein